MSAKASRLRAGRMWLTSTFSRRHHSFGGKHPCRRHAEPSRARENVSFLEKT